MRTPVTPTTSPMPMRWLMAVVILGGCASRAKQPSPSIGQPVLDESALMTRLRTEVKSEPSSALSLSDEGERRFGDSPSAEERRALAIRALINLDRIGAARSRAYEFLERYPQGPYTANVAAMTGVHVTPHGPGAKH